MNLFSKINFINNFLISKEDIIESLQLYIKHCEETDEEGWSENKRNVILTILYKFLDLIKKMQFPDIKISDWHYEYKWISDGIVLELVHLDSIEFDEYGEVISAETSNFIQLAEVKCAYLSVEEYAQKYGVTVTTVRQWIRRGKLRSAIKLGRNWLIPELTDKPRRGYEPVTYRWEYLSDELVKTFPYLSKCYSLRIMQDDTDSSIYNILLFNKHDRIYERLRLNIKEREKLELALISENSVTVEELFMNIIYVPPKQRAYYLKGDKIMCEKEMREYKENLNLLEKNGLEISTNSYFRNSNGVYLWFISSQLYHYNDSVDNFEPVVQLKEGIIIPSQTEFYINTKKQTYCSISDLCDSISEDIFAVYNAIANDNEGIRVEILNELNMPDSLSYESSILYIQDITTSNLDYLKIFLDSFDIIKESLPSNNCHLAVTLINWEQETGTAKTFLESGWKLKNIDSTCIIAYKNL